MKINRTIDGQYSEIKLEDGKKVFLSVLPDRITVSTMVLFFPTKKIWEFVFPFYIRTSAEVWESSKAILKAVLDSISDVRDLNELQHCLKTKTSKSLRDYSKEHDEETRNISVDKVGMHAIKQMLNPKELQKIETIIHEYGKVLEKVGQETIQKYPAVVYPQSLLPYPKEVIEKTLNDGLYYIDDEKMIENIKACRAFLIAFIDNKEANRRNNELLNNKGFQEAMKKRLSKR
jgi:hypothetical protein